MLQLAYVTCWRPSWAPGPPEAIVDLYKPYRSTVWRVTNKWFGSNWE